MPDDPVIMDNLRMILESIDLIEKRFHLIDKPDKFVSNQDGVFVLDAISMRLQVIGELLKKISRIDNSVLSQHNEINWDNIMRLRDIVSHHYEKIDHEIIFDICKNHLGPLKKVIEQIINDMES